MVGSREWWAEGSAWWAVGSDGQKGVVGSRE